MITPNDPLFNLMARELRAMGAVKSSGAVNVLDASRWIEKTSRTFYISERQANALYDEHAMKPFMTYKAIAETIFPFDRFVLDFPYAKLFFIKRDFDSPVDAGGEVVTAFFQIFEMKIDGPHPNNFVSVEGIDSNDKGHLSVICGKGLQGEVHDPALRKDITAAESASFSTLALTSVFSRLLLHSSVAVEYLTGKRFGSRPLSPGQNMRIILKPGETVERAMIEVASGKGMRAPVSPRRRHWVREFIRTRGGRVETVGRHIRGGKDGPGRPYAIDDGLLQFVGAK